MFERLRQWSRIIRRDTTALYFATRDPRTPWYAKAVAGCVVGYALSPIDLIPDFIPFIGYLDDIVLVPVGLWLALRLVPIDVMEESRSRAAQIGDRPSSRIAAIVVVLVWVGAAAMAGWIGYNAIAG